MTCHLTPQQFLPCEARTPIDNAKKPYMSSYITY